jgi:hypothetical protein
MMVWAVSLLSAELSPDVLTAVVPHIVFVVCQGWVPLARPSPKQSSTPRCYRTTLALKLFRGEPAISRFDWHFTANHRSSGHFATSLRFGPPRSFTCRFSLPMVRSPGFGSNSHGTLIRPIQPRFHYASDK